MHDEMDGLRWPRQAGSPAAAALAWLGWSELPRQLLGAAVAIRTHGRALKGPSFIVANVRIRRQKTMKKTPASHTLTQ